MRGRLVTAPGDRFDGEYIRAYFREVDAMRPRELVKWYTPEGSFRFANNPPVVGADAMIETLEQFYATLKFMLAMSMNFGPVVLTNSGPASVL